MRISDWSSDVCSSDLRRERDWEQFHNLRTLSTSIVLEAAELAEITQWAKDYELAEIEKEKRRRIEEEVADIAILLSYLLNDAGIDLEQAVATKLELNDQIGRESCRDRVCKDV